MSHYVRLAEAGERVLVTDRDRVVAELGPPQGGTAELSRDAVLADAVRSGWLRPPLLPRGTEPPRQPVAKLDELLAELDRSREDR